VVIRVQLKVPESDWGRNNGEQRIRQWRLWRAEDEELDPGHWKSSRKPSSFISKGLIYPSPKSLGSWHHRLRTAALVTVGLSIPEHKSCIRAKTEGTTFCHHPLMLEAEDYSCQVLGPLMVKPRVISLQSESLKTFFGL
jgi:hypothetical protein